MKLTVISRNAGLIDALQAVLDGGSAATDARFVRDAGLAAWLGGIERAAQVRLHVVAANEPADDAVAARQDLPEILILDGSDRHNSGFDEIERLTQYAPQTTVFLLSEDQTPQFLLAAMRAGVREVLPLPLEPAGVHAALARADGRRAVRGAPPGNGKILGFTACKGGSGATFLAANTAYALAAEHGKRVLLIDLDLQYGDASFFFMHGEPAAGSVATVVREGGRMDATLLAASCLRILPNFHLLAAPEEAEDIVNVTPALVGRLLELAAAHYDYVLFDVNRSFDANALAALDRADGIFAVMQSMVPDMRDARTMLRAFRQLGYPDSKLHFIVNRSDKKEDAPLKPIERGLGVDFYRTIPNDYLNASASVNQGVSIVKLAPASPVSRALCGIAADLAGATGGQEHWFRKLLRRA